MAEALSHLELIEHFGQNGRFLRNDQGWARHSDSKKVRVDRLSKELDLPF